MTQINITCETCNTIHKVERTKEIPSNVVAMKCNWCPLCEDMADDYYREWYSEFDSKEPTINTPIPSNQLVFPFIIDEITESSIPERAPDIIKVNDNGTKELIYDFGDWPCLP